jgi:hypothetical protein
MVSADEASDQPPSWEKVVVFRKATASEISARKAEKQRARPRPRPNRLQQPIAEMDSPDWHAPRCANCCSVLMRPLYCSLTRMAFLKQPIPWVSFGLSVIPMEAPDASK